MVKTVPTTLSRRERQIIDILYRRGRATAADVMTDLSGNPSYTTVRTQLRVMEAKGHVRHEEHGPHHPEPPRAADYRHPVSAGPGDGRRRDDGSLRESELFDRPHAAPGDGREGPRAPRRARSALRLHADNAAADGAQVRRGVVG